VIDLKFTPSRATSVDEINDIMKKAAAGSMKSVLSIVDEPLVSIDFNHSPYSSNFDVTQTQVVDSHFCRVVSWYDNEWGFSNRMSDVAVEIAKFIK
jgi:glyceraldehyde 3-phosphate dehydrogenase